jgi:hypothetical protein
VPHGESLTAGAIYDNWLNDSVVQGSALYVEKRNGQDIRRLVQPWQARAMSYYDLVPEVKFAAQFYSQLLRKVRLFPARIDPETQEPEEITDGPALEVFNRITDRAGGRAELQGQYGKLKFLIGECYLTVSPDLEREEVWECLSPNELRVQPGGIATRFRAPQLSGDEYLVGNDVAHADDPNIPDGPAFSDKGPDVIVVYRLWRPHPAYSWLADCNMQSAVDILEELVLSTYSVRAQLKSRLNRAGILWVPDEISFTSLGNDPEEDPNSDEFQERLQQVIMAAISDPGSAAAFAPIVARVAAEFIGKIEYTRFNDKDGELAEISQRSEMVERFAVGQELPPELFKSQGDLNHWTGWLIDEQTWKSYGHPAALEMASDLNAAYLQPTLKAENFAEWDTVVIGIDPSEVINHPNRGQDAKTLYDARAISKSVLRDSLGYNDNDAPEDDELNEMIGVAIHDGSYAKYGIPSVRTSIEPAAGEIESPAGTADEPPGNPATGSGSEPGPPAGGPGVDDTSGGPAVTAAGVSREQQILGAAAFAVHRARELAGSRLRAMTSPRGPRDARCDECQDAINGVPNWDVAAVLGIQQVRQVANGSEPTLVDGAGQAFAAVVEGLGVTREWASELGALVERHALSTLYQAQPEGLPAAFESLLRRLDVPLERA